MKHLTVTLQLDFDYEGPETENLKEAFQKLAREIENETYRAPEGVSNVASAVRVIIADVHEADPPTCCGDCGEGCKLE